MAISESKISESSKNYERVLNFQNFYRSSGPDLQGECIFVISDLESTLNWNFTIAAPLELQIG